MTVADESSTQRADAYIFIQTCIGDLSAFVSGGSGGGALAVLVRIDLTDCVCGRLKPNVMFCSLMFTLVAPYLWQTYFGLDSSRSEMASRGKSLLVSKTTNEASNHEHFFLHALHMRIHLCYRATTVVKDTGTCT